MFVRSLMKIPTRLIMANNVRLLSTGVSSDLVLAEEINDAGVLTLNRPKSLNALNLEMVQNAYEILSRWQDTRTLVIVKGAGEKAFCAGGDVKGLIEDGSVAEGKKFFRHEYTLDHLIGTYKIPYIALIDGIVMGGGVGLSVHGKYRIATERTLFAMPETAIGLFPDVGGTYFLPRLQGKLGVYLGLTGFRLKGKDVLKAGIATHYCESSEINNLKQSLLSVKHASEIEDVLQKRCLTDDSSEFCLAKHLEQINKCFSAPTVEGIIKKLEEDGTEWAQKTIKTLRTVSPLSLKVSLHGIQLGATRTLAQCLQTEYRLAGHCLQDSDFSEGVRALLITKNNSPKWNPSTIEEVTEDRVLSFFKPLSGNDELQLANNPTSKL